MFHGDKRFLFTAVQLLVVFAIFIWIGVPLLMYFFPAIGGKLIFFNIYVCPWYSNLTDFAHFGLPPRYARNFYLPSVKDGVRLGFWHLLPDSSRTGHPTPSDMEAMLAGGGPVVLYLHGNALNRGGRHMVDLYGSLTALGLHVVAVDYRGYGDSEGSPRTEDDVVSDALTAWNYLREATRGRSPVIMWGHSLGTGVSASLLRRLAQRGEGPSAVVLESAFTSMEDGTRYHPLTKIYRAMPYFEEVFVRNPEKNGVYFNTLENILIAECPVLLLHSADDHIIHSFFSDQIYEKLKAHGKDVEYKLFPAGNRYYHVDLWRAPDFQDVVQQFVTKVTTNSKAQDQSE